MCESAFDHKLCAYAIETAKNEYILGEWLRKPEVTAEVIDCVSGHLERRGDLRALHAFERLVAEMRPELGKAEDLPPLPPGYYTMPPFALSLEEGRDG